MERERRRADCVSPNSGQAPKHRFGVTKSSEGSEQPAESCDDSPFFQQHFADLLRRESEGEKSADFGRALLETELKEHGHEEEGRDDEEDAEAEEEITKVLRLICGFKRLLADG